MDQHGVPRLTYQLRQLHITSLAHSSSEVGHLRETELDVVSCGYGVKTHHCRDGRLSTSHTYHGDRRAENSRVTCMGVRGHVSSRQ